MLENVFRVVLLLGKGYLGVCRKVNFGCVNMVIFFGVFNIEIFVIDQRQEGIIVNNCFFVVFQKIRRFENVNEFFLL